nr:putative ORF1 [Marmot picobirnavirus]
MTEMLVKYWTLMENKRSNLAKEQEQHRSNITNEDIQRDRIALGYAELGERQRSNLANEKEYQRSNLANEEINRLRARTQTASTAANIWQGFQPKSVVYTGKGSEIYRDSGSKSTSKAITGATVAKTWQGLTHLPIAVAFKSQFDAANLNIANNPQA